MWWERFRKDGQIQSVSPQKKADQWLRAKWRGIAWDAHSRVAVERVSLRLRFDWNTTNIMALMGKMDMVMCPVSLKSLSFVLDIFLTWDECARRYLFNSCRHWNLSNMFAWWCFQLTRPGHWQISGIFTFLMEFGHQSDIILCKIPLFSDGLSWYRFLGEKAPANQISPTGRFQAIRGRLRKTHVSPGRFRTPGKGAHAKGRH